MDEPHSATSTDPTPTGRTLQELPTEIQRAVFKHCSSSDLIALALVSKHFHTFACAQLYRTFSIVFPDDDDPAFESPIDGLAGGLDTMVSSEYEHAKHLKEIVLDSLSGGQDGERAYRHYSLEVSCGKFMNTLLMLCLRKAKALESFHWNIRVELSRPVLKALQEIPNLRNLHIRLQHGPSLHQAPPPLPSIASATPPPPPPPSDSLATTLSSPLISSIKPKDASPATASADPPKPATEPPSFAGFKSLTSLAVLDMDTLDYLPELSSCIEASSLNLKKLKLSISERVARTARRPVFEDSDDSDQEVDEFGNNVNQALPSPPLQGMPEGTQEKEAKVRVALSAQEQILGKIFQVDKPLPEEKKDKDKSRTGSEQTAPRKADTEASAKLIDSLKKTIKALVEATEDVNPTIKELVEATEDVSPQHTRLGQDTLDAVKTIGKSMKQLMEVTLQSEQETLAKQALLQSEGEGRENGKIADKDAVEGSKEVADTKEEKPEESEPSSTVDKVDDSVETPDLFGDENQANGTTTKPQSSKGTALEEIDIEHPDVVDEDIEDDESATELPAAIIPNSPDHEKNAESGGETTVTNVTMSGGLKEPEEADKNAEAPGTSGAGVPLSKKGSEKDILSKEEAEQAMKDYVRSTRKLGLRSLSLYLIPIRCSVLFHAIDLAALSRITLLNVGPQTPFWTFMSTIHKTTPLKLERIFTDNVSAPFLALVNALDGLKELFILERSHRAQVEPLAAKTTVTMDDIRRQVLKKHAKSLERLMIKNDSDWGWDLDTKTIQLLTRRGRNLKELAVSIGLSNFHLLLQHLPGLSSLQALHIVSFRIEDTCPTVKRDLLRFAVDVVAQHPQMKLEHIALDSDVHRLLRKPVTERKKRRKSKENTEQIDEPNAVAATPAPPEDDEEDESSHSTDSDNSASDSSSHGVVHRAKRAHLRIETLENVKFYDVYGIRIFRKDVRAGSL
ncbi:MAG: hypothetical protein M4579_000794 [Chaenotheca gracillima]|nr:MAG: hypothetical protein M4579_000794 [Chaenotheca gracillima]